MSELLIIAAIACLLMGVRADYRREGETHEVFWPPFAFHFGPGTNWSIAGLVLALFAVAAR